MSRIFAVDFESYSPATTVADYIYDPRYEIIVAPIEMQNTMTKAEAQRRQHLNTTLQSLGFTPEECDSLRRISMTLHRWHEGECGIDGGCIERDDFGAPYWHNSMTGRCRAIPDRETGAKKRLDKVLWARNIRDGGGRGASGRGLEYYIQTDPRGPALYILRPGDVPEGQTADCCYSHGIAVY